MSYIGEYTIIYQNVDILLKISQKTWIITIIKYELMIPKYYTDN